jgi:nitrate reductase assembly molybdenum cofactor insertion protein NarJ
MADCTYANVLADSLGLSPLTSDAQIVSHLSKVLEENETPYGLLVQTVGAATHKCKQIKCSLPLFLSR